MAFVLSSVYDGTPSESEEIFSPSHKSGDQAPILSDFMTNLLGERTLLACIKAPHDTDDGPTICFVAREELCSTNYQKRFDANATIEILTSEGNPSVAKGSRPAFDANTHTHVDIGEMGIPYGSTKPYDTIHFAYDHCDESACNPVSFRVETSSVRSTGS